METLNNVTTANGYTDAATLVDQEATVLDLLVTNAAVYARFRPYDTERQNLLEWGDEVFLAPGAKLYNGCAGVEIRSAVAGTPAQVSATLYGPGDVVPTSAVDVSYSVQPDGTVTPQGQRGVTGIVNSDGTVAGGTGFAVLHAGTGLYEITFETPFAAPPVVQLTAIAEAQLINIAPGTLTQNGFTARSLSTFSTLADSAFTFVAQAVN